MNILSKIFAFILLVALLPLFFIIIICSFIFQGTPIFFIQERVGFKNSPFNIYKFRTMIKNNSMDRIAGLNDDRITKWGKILRNYKLDELPQLINIIKGEMVFVGPRPELYRYVSRHNDFFQYLDKIRPGITDLSSILFRDESKIKSIYFKKDGYYGILKIKSDLTNFSISNQTFFYNLKIIFITIVTFFFPIFAIKKLVLPLIATGFPEYYKI
jgi:Sugar transferases involved in lipopolysaccharide synthesis